MLPPYHREIFAYDNTKNFNKTRIIFWFLIAIFRPKTIEYFLEAERDFRKHILRIVGFFFLLIFYLGFLF